MSKSAQDIKIQYGYLIYPFDDVIKNIFMKDKTVIKYSLSESGETTSPQYIPKDFRILLEESGIKLVPVEIKYLCGIKEICGIRINITKLGNKNKRSKSNKSEITSLLIRISGINDEDLDQKIETIREFLKINHGLNPETSNFMFSRTDRC